MHDVRLRLDQELPVLTPYFQHVAARAYIELGEPDKALDLIETMLKVPYFVSPGWLRVDPSFAGLRGNGRFEALIR